MEIAMFLSCEKFIDANLIKCLYSLSLSLSFSPHLILVFQFCALISTSELLILRHFRANKFRLLLTMILPFRDRERTSTPSCPSGLAKRHGNEQDLGGRNLHPKSQSWTLESKKQWRINLEEEEKRGT